MSEIETLYLAAVRKPVLSKPKWGQPCNGCGACCIAGPCHVAEQLGEAEGRACRFLLFDDGRYWCGIVREPERFGVGTEEAHAAAFLLGMGLGCGMDDEEETL